MRATAVAITAAALIASSCSGGGEDSSDSRVPIEATSTSDSETSEPLSETESTISTTTSTTTSTSTTVPADLSAGAAEAVQGCIDTWLFLGESIELGSTKFTDEARTACDAADAALKNERIPLAADLTVAIREVQLAVSFAIVAQLDGTLAEGAGPAFDEQIDRRRGAILLALRGGSYNGPTGPLDVQFAEKADLPIVDDGVYLVGTEVAPGTYRVGSYWAMLDENQDIIDNDLTGDCLSLMVLTDQATYVEISGQAILVADLPNYDPIAEEGTDGSFLVGADIQPGQYRLTPTSSDDSTYWARLDGNLDIIDNDLQDGQSIVVIQDGDFAFTFSGVLEAL